MASKDEEMAADAKQRAILDTFFYLIGHFSYDKAKEFLEKEKELSLKSHKVSPFFAASLASLCQLAIAEKNYANLTYLGPRSFLRKDTLVKSAFENIKADLHKVQMKYISFAGPASSVPPSPPSVTPSQSPSTASDSVLSTSRPRTSTESFCNLVPDVEDLDSIDKVMNHLCFQLLHFVSARLELMEFYEKMCAMSAWKYINYEQLLEIISNISWKYHNYFHFPTLSPIRASFRSECEILSKMLDSCNNMQNWKFLPSLLSLFQAHAKLSEWGTVTKEAKRGSITEPIRHHSPPAMYTWVCSLKAALLSKFSLYFHDVLSKQTVPQEMKYLCSKNSIDYFQKIVSFQKRYDAACVAVVLDTNELESYRGHGYVHPDKPYEPPKGLNTYPAIVCSPPERPISHWPSLVSIMDNEDKQLQHSEQPITFYDKRLNSTYFLIAIEPRMTLVSIFDTKKSEKDTNITRFMLQISGQLRCNRTFASLKPGFK